MPDIAETQHFPFICEGGLVSNRSTFIMKAGEALQLENFEPDVEGGYRRISGFRRHVRSVVPVTATSDEAVLLITFFNNNVIAARGEKIFSSASTDLGRNSIDAITSSATMSGSGTITVKNTTGFSSSGSIVIDSEEFTYTGKTTTTFTGVTRATNSTSAAAHTATGDVNRTVVSETWTVRDTGRTDAGKYSFERFNYDGGDKIVFVDGTNAPVVDEDNFQSGQGAGSVKVDDTIVGLKVFRDALFIFCQNRIFKLTGSSSANFAVTPVTRNIGCINGKTIQEFAGDLIFLGPDGLRTVAGTQNIGDVNLGTISSNVQSIFDDNILDSGSFESVIIPEKTQYRLFFSKSAGLETRTQGIICVLKQQENGQQAYEFSEVKGIKPSCTDSFIEEGNILVLHGGFDGYIYRQEEGNDFDGEAINAKYRSSDLTMNDPGIRKHMQRVIVNFKPESSIDADLFVRYDYESAASSRPAAYPLDSSDIAGIYGVSTYGGPTYGGASQPLVRQAVEGSGFAVALRVNDGGITAPYSLKGFQLEFDLGARR